MELVEKVSGYLLEALMMEVDSVVQPVEGVPLEEPAVNCFHFEALNLNVSQMEITQY